MITAIDIGMTFAPLMVLGLAVVGIRLFLHLKKKGIF